MITDILLLFDIGDTLAESWAYDSWGFLLSLCGALLASWPVLVFMVRKREVPHMNQ
jgi:hypothetical protein